MSRPPDTAIGGGPACGPTAPGPYTPPRYGAGSLTDLLPSVLAALGAPGDDVLGLAGRLAGVRRVVLLLVDGLGRHLLPAAAPVAPVLAGALAGRYARLTSLTCGFPSTTPTNLVSLATGVPPGGHGVVGFTVAVPGTGRTLTHVLWDADVDPRRWQPRATQFGRAAAAGIGCSVVGRPRFARSGLTRAAYAGATYRGAEGGPATVAAVRDALAGGGRRLVYVYHPDVDRAGHRSGPGSADWLSAVTAADDLVGGLAAVLPDDAALLVTADHGALAADETHKIDLDGLPQLSAGTRLVTGEARARHVHTVSGAVPDVLAAWRDTLGDRARVVERGAAIAAGWFGATGTAAAARIGDVVVVPTDRYCLVRRRADPAEASLRGYHGALSRTEMTVPLLILRPGESVGGAR